jgi:hypothetical protein
MMELPTLKFGAKPLLPPCCFGRDEIRAMFSERSSVSGGYSARVGQEHSMRSSSQPMSILEARAARHGALSRGNRTHYAHAR